MTVHSLNRYNCSEFLQVFEKNSKNENRLIIDFTYLYNIDSFGFNTFLTLRKKAQEMGIQIYILGKDNFQLNQFINRVQFRDW